MADESNSAIIFDYDMFGDNDTNGFVDVFFDEEALKNSLRLWFASKRGERFRAIERGGFFMSQVDKTMSDSDIKSLSKRLASSLQKDFNGTITPKSIILTPDYTRKLINVSLIVYASFLNTDVTFNENFKSRF